MEVAWAWLKQTNDLKDDELKHGQRQRECNAKDKLYQNVANLIVSKKLLHKKYPSAGEKTNLQNRETINDL